MRLPQLPWGRLELREELRTAMAMGIDRGCLLTDRCLAGGDTIATARALAKGLSRLGTYDLILAGAESSDGATGQVDRCWQRPWGFLMFPLFSG